MQSLAVAMELFKEHDYQRMTCYDHDGHCCSAGCHGLQENQYEHYARIATETGICYDSSLDTLRHSRRVDELLLEILTRIQDRLTRHDQSKLEDPEKEVFDEFSPKLGKLEYGSQEYKDSLLQMQPALVHHYAHNRHHPEYHEAGIGGMTLVDLIEMLADWKAATERNKNGDLAKSLAIQKERFEISDQLLQVLENTARELEWIS